MVNKKRTIARGLCASVIALICTAATISASAGQKLLNAGFESGLDGFAARANETVSRSSAKAYEGSYSLMVSDRSAAWNGAAVLLDNS